jgi:4-hydroxythreonine-4-phosphate dehydrogenase
MMNTKRESSSNAESPVIGITMGCPVGIGPEIILRLFSGGERSVDFRPVVLGDVGVLERCARELAFDVMIQPWQPGTDRLPIEAGVVPVLPVSSLDQYRLVWGQPDVDTGTAMAGYIKEAVRLVQNGTIGAMATCPIAKTVLQAAGYRFPGHTEMLASLCKVTDYGMMMAGNRLRVTLVTIHTPLARVPDMLDQEEVFRLIRLTHHTLCEDFGIRLPRIGVAGLNPHAGEGGLFGDEENRAIVPAIAGSVAAGWQVTGPLPPDTVFHRAMAGEFDAVVCMYHDQGLIPFKLIHFIDGVNVTMGLPIVRTSVDHGTAYDIAGKGLASPASLEAACRLAAAIAINRGKFKAETQGEDVDAKTAH